MVELSMHDDEIIVVAIAIEDNDTGIEPEEVFQKSIFIGLKINQIMSKIGLLKIRRQRIQQHTDIKKYRDL